MMKTLFIKICLAASYVCLQIPIAKANVPELKKIFEKTFSTHYAQGGCMNNIMRLVKEAQLKSIDLRRAQVLEIKNTGFSVFGRLNAELARDSGSPAPAGSAFRYLAGETNWSYHVVLELDGYIFDYDFTNAPTVLPKEKYAELMFLQERPREEGGRFFSRREDKLYDYEILVHDASAALSARSSGKAMPVLQTTNLKTFFFDK